MSFNGWPTVLSAVEQMVSHVSLAAIVPKVSIAFPTVEKIEVIFVSKMCLIFMYPDVFYII